MILGRHPTKPGVWALAVILTLLLHVGVVIAARVLRPLSPDPSVTPDPGIINLVFIPEAEATSQEPSFFTELPPDRAGEKPERPDFLSNVDSRARDSEPGGEDESLPSLEGKSEAPHVRMDAGSPDAPDDGPEEGATAGRAAESGESPEGGGDVPRPEDRADPLSESAEPTDAPPQTDDADPEAPAVSAPSPMSPRSPLFLDDRPVYSRREGGDSAGEDDDRPGAGSSDSYQEEMSNPDGNVFPYGDVSSLSTVAWDYAPWLQQFGRDIKQRWRVPYAYYLGVIHGWTQIEIEVARNGDLLRMDVLGEQGHESLKNSSVGVLRAAMPYRPLPDHFPEESLILRIKLIYPDRGEQPGR
jgi:hypothetical protein